MQEFVKGCSECDPRTEPERADELLKAAAELGIAILKQRKKQKADIPYQQIVNEYNRICGGVMSKVTKLTDKRKRSLKNCINQGFTVDDIYTAFKKAAAVPFLTGKNERNWTAGFDFIIKPDNLVKIIEGVYGDGNVETVGEHSYNLNMILEQAVKGGGA